MFWKFETNKKLLIIKYMYTFLKLDTDWSLSMHNILNYKTIKIIQNIDTSGLNFLNPERCPEHTNRVPQFLK